MNVAAFTSGDVDFASSRMRSFYIFQSRIWKKHNIAFNPCIYSIHKFHCIHIQKKFTLNFILVAIFSRILGKMVVFDIDDQAQKKLHKIAVFIMVVVSSMVTTDTCTRKKYLKKITRKKAIYVIPDVLDEDGALTPRRYKDESSKIRLTKNTVILWVGNADNYNSFRHIIELDSKLAKYEVLIITDLLKGRNISLDHPNYSIKQWSNDWRKKLKFDCDYYMVLNHNAPEDKNSVYKSENKMLTAICSYIVPIVSDTYSYRLLAKSINAEYLVFNKYNSVYDIISKVKSNGVEWRKEFLVNSYNFIYKKYNAEAISTKLLKKMNDVYKYD